MQYMGCFMEKIMEVDELNLTINDKKVIDNLSFSIEEGSLNAFLCSNSSGKTTLIKTLSGIINNDSGKIVVNDIELSKKNFKDYALSISTILEDVDNSFLCNKVEDEIRYPLNNLDYDLLEINRIVENLSELLKISTILGKDISRLTQFEKVKTLIAASIAHTPKVLLVDDILRFLNEKEKKEIIKIFKSINTKLNIAIIFTTSDINDIIDLKNIYVFNNLSIAFKGTYKEVIKKDNDLTKFGFYIPTMIDLSRKLEFYNLLDEIYYDKDRLVDKLWN
jgi:energy-coupling factor transport system ATP-binding protein